MTEDEGYKKTISDLRKQLKELKQENIRYKRLFDSLPADSLQNDSSDSDPASEERYRNLC